MIDGHCHLSDAYSCCEEAMDALHAAARECGVNRITLLNIPELAYDNYEVLDKAKKFEGFFRIFPAVNPLDPIGESVIEKLKARGATGIKLHPRFHGYPIASENCISLVRIAGEVGLPVIIDCFPDAKNMSLNNFPVAFITLAEKAPATRIAICHSGGHYILDALMVAKYHRNIYLDISFTLLYYRQSSVIQDICYVIKSLRAERIFWGTDYPDRPYRNSVEFSMSEFARMDLSEEERQRVLNVNSNIFAGVEDE